MLESDRRFSGSVAENYDRHLVPLIFASYAADLARRAARFAPRAVLEIAAGTGVLTRALAPALAGGASYVVTDLNPPMLAYAESRQPADRHISWRAADAAALPFGAAGFDLVCCQFGAMFFPDRGTAYREARRVLVPGGRFLFSVWDRIEDNEISEDVTRALAKLYPDDPPRFLARVPHGYHDPAVIARDLGEAGFTGVSIETRADRNSPASPLALAVAYCQGTPLRDEIEARDPGGLQSAAEHAAAAIAERHGIGEVAARIQAHVIAAVA